MKVTCTKKNILFGRIVAVKVREAPQYQQKQHAMLGSCLDMMAFAQLQAEDRSTEVRKSACVLWVIV